MDRELKAFIEYHKLDPDDFFDAKGQPAKSCYNEMKAKDKLFAYNTTACMASGHTVSDRHGHCIMCNTTSIAFIYDDGSIGIINYAL
jgi:hypothetical protein